VVVLLISVIAAAYVLRTAFDLPLHYTQLLVLLAVALINAGAGWAVVGLRDIRRLTSPSHASRPYGYN
jgi:type II secretory pathway component PulK